MRENEIIPYGSLEKRSSTDFNDFSAFLDKVHELPHGEPFTYGATPLDRSTTLQQQLELAISLQEQTYRDIPEDVPMEIIDFVHTTFVARFHNRGEANEENYTTALNDDVSYSPEMLQVIKRGELGTATPSELLLIQWLKGIRSVELACLTHPYGKRVEDVLPEMRDAVQQHVELSGGTYLETPEVRYRVKEVVGYPKGEEQFDKGLLMTRKRTLGSMPDGTIIRERSSFVVRLDDKTIFTDEDRNALSAVDMSQPDWQDELVKTAHLDEIVPMLLEMDQYSLAIPISTTIYAFNTETAELVERRETEKLRKRRSEFAEQHPVLAAAMEHGPDSLFALADKHGMYYKGPEAPARSFADELDKQLNEFGLDS